MDLLLVRHGESEGNIAIEAAKVGDDRWMTSAYRERSAANYRLTPTGREQATRAGEWLREWTSRRGGFDRLYCSPFVRTRETAGLLGLHNAQWQLEPLLRERDFGLWEGLGKAETEERFPHSFAQKSRHKFLWRPECGESTPDLDMRAREVLASLAREMSGRRVLCVTHEDIIWAFKFRLEKMTLEVFLAHQESEGKDIPNCGIVHYTRDDRTGRSPRSSPGCVWWTHRRRASRSGSRSRGRVSPTGTFWTRWGSTRTSGRTGQASSSSGAAQRRTGAQLLGSRRVRCEDRQMTPATDKAATPPSPFEAAFNVARCHEERGQTDKLGAPYLEHVRRVVDRVAAIAPDHLVESAKVAAALHDVVEDCKEITLEDLRTAGFSEAVVAAVGSVTRGDDEEYFDMVRRAAQDEIGRWVKLADNLDNSDPDRARALPEEDRERLKAKYAEARAILAKEGAVDPNA